MASISFNGVVRECKHVREFTVLRVEEFYPSNDGVKSYVYKVLIRGVENVPLASMVNVSGEIVFRPDLSDLVVDKATLGDSGVSESKSMHYRPKPPFEGERRRSEPAAQKRPKPRFVDDHRSQAGQPVKSQSPVEKQFEPNSQPKPGRFVDSRREAPVTKSAPTQPRAVNPQQMPMKQSVDSNPQRQSSAVFKSVKEIDLMGAAPTSSHREVAPKQVHVEEPVDSVEEYHDHRDTADYDAYCATAQNEEVAHTPVKQKAKSMLDDASSW